MPPTSDGSASGAYRPTSLDFINLPNPIEPHAEAQRHPLNGAPRLDKNHTRLEPSSNQDLFKLILDPSNDQPNKRQKLADNPHLDLPKLPVRKPFKRPRIPPTLSGLHQPPPNAGLLPSINVDKPQSPTQRLSGITRRETASQTRDRAKRPEPPVSAIPNPASSPEKASETTPVQVQKKRIRKKWSDDETKHLLEGVARFGVGHWTMILKCPDYNFAGRTALDLKDRFRICCPDQYRPSNALKTISTKISSGCTDLEKQRSDPHKAITKGPPSERLSTSKLKEFGINEPFMQTGRRSRRAYSAIEDENLLKGFRRHGNKWARIQKDAALDLSHRKPTDLRERFHIRYPEEVAKAHTASQSDVAAAKTSEAAHAPKDTEAEGLSESSRNVASDKRPTMPEMIDKGEEPVLKSHHAKKYLQPLHFSLNDVFLGARFGEDDNDAENEEPVTLDRGILDWALPDVPKPLHADTSKSHGIDPRVTLNLPRPVTNNITLPAPSHQQAQPAGASTALPPLSAWMPDADNADPFSLPSLIFSDATETGGRHEGFTIPSLDELLNGSEALN